MEHAALPQRRQPLRYGEALHYLGGVHRHHGLCAEPLHVADARHPVRPRVRKDRDLHHAQEQLVPRAEKAEITVIFRPSLPARPGGNADSLPPGRKAGDPRRARDDEKHKPRLCTQFLVADAEPAKMLLACFLREPQCRARLQRIPRPHVVRRNREASAILIVYFFRYITHSCSGSRRFPYICAGPPAP